MFDFVTITVQQSDKKEKEKAQAAATRNIANCILGMLYTAMFAPLFKYSGL